MSSLSLAIKSNFLYKKVEPFLPSIILFISIGPSLFGWVVGLWYYDRESSEFKASFQHFIFFIAYAILLMINQGLGFFIIFKYQNYTAYFESLLAVIYIGICLYYYLNMKKGNFNFMPTPFVISSKNSLNKISSDNNSSTNNSFIKNILDKVLQS